MFEIATDAAGIATLLIYVALLLLLLIVLRGFHQKNKAEIRVIRKRLGLGERANFTGEGE